MQQFYIYRKDKEYGPFTYENIQSFIKEKKISDVTLCRNERMQGYLPLRLIRQTASFQNGGEPVMTTHSPASSSTGRKKKASSWISALLIAACAGGGVWFYLRDSTLEDYTALFEKKAADPREQGNREFWISMANATRQSDQIDNIDFLMVGEKSNIPFLTAAADKGASKLVRYLLRHGASVDIRDASRKTPLRLAARKGSLTTVNELVTAKADINATDSQDRTPLMGAAWMGHKDVVEYLLKHGASIDAIDKIGQTALAWAAEGGKKDIVSMLIDAGAQFENKWEKNSPVRLAITNGHFMIADKLLNTKPSPETTEIMLRQSVYQSDIPLARFAFEHGAPLKDDIWGNALKYGNPQMVELMMSQGADPLKKVKMDHVEKTPLDAAINSGNMDTINMILRKGAVPTASSLYAAIRHDKKDAAQLVIGKGISPLAVDKGTGDLLSFAIQRVSADLAELLLSHGLKLDTRNESRETPLMKAIYLGRTSLVKLFLEKGAQADDVDNNGLSPLMIAAYQGKTDIYNLVRKYSKKPAVKDQKGRSVLRWAAKGGNTDIIRDVLNIPGINVNEKDTQDGETPLMSAANNGNLEAVRLLLDKGADVNTKGKNGETALLWAAKGWLGTWRKTHEPIIEYLVDKGADVNARDKDGETAFSLVMQHKKYANFDSKAVNKIGDMLLRHNADPGNFPIKDVSLFSAVRENNPVLVQILITKGADVNKEEDDGDTPLIAASWAGYLDIVKILVERGANVNAVKQSDGATALSAASNQQIADYLKEHGAK